MNNFRDIGYQNIHRGLLFRGCELSDLPQDDEELLFGSCGIKTVIDLRSVEEVDAKKDSVISDVQVINIPLLTIAEMSEMVQGQFPDVAAAYRNAVKPEKKPLWTQIFEILLDEQSGPILIHCTQGKDRTGIVVAIILSALGLDKSVIYEDYERTNTFASMPAEYRAYAETMPEDIRKLFEGLFFVNRDFLEESFLEIDKQFGSLDGFLRQCCSLNDDKLMSIRQKYLQ